ncbi:MAG TPA: SHOCT domain-containing protein [Syntrophales bacterium]|nr:SHOCT domain-containing protein [Syntrophales bacterium]
MSMQGDGPLVILKKRYARGEITKEEFDRMKKDMEG